MIDQSVWRIDLPDPDYIRIPNEVHNLIIHHTAGSNTDTNYIQVIRNIYIFHTEVRGWSDIGYNYVIAQDGTIFKARDPGGLEQDNVLGAHFCASNTGTMGISMMGTYTDIAPPDTALQSLVKLLNWKAGKDSLDPLGHYPHPLNPALPVIAGHRDGCATECPGEMLYEKLQEIRDSTWEAFQACGYFVKPVLNLNETMNFAPDVHITGRAICIYSREDFRAELYDLSGKKLAFSIEKSSPEETNIIPRISSPSLVALVLFYRQQVITRLVFWP